MPDAELLVLRVLDRPPRVGELYYCPKAPEPSNTRVYRLQQGNEAAEAVASMRAVVPVEDYLTGAAERVACAVVDAAKNHATGCPSMWAITPSTIRAALLPPPPEPDVEPWMLSAQQELRLGGHAVGSGNGIAKVIAKHWEGAKDA